MKTIKKIKPTGKTQPSISEQTIIENLGAEKVLDKEVVELKKKIKKRFSKYINNKES